MLIKNTKKYLIFTDLDGTLIDHNSYSFDKANEMITYIKDNNIPLIIVTSKTQQEVLNMQKQLNISHPFIVENGGGIFIPHDTHVEQITMGKTYTEALEFIELYKDIFNITSFSDMTVEEVSKLTGLNEIDSSLAKKRDFTEPFIIEDESNITVLKELCKQEGFDIVKGGRFYHLITLGQDKANAIMRLKKIYEEKNTNTYTTIALGDGENDKTMLDCSDISILIKKFDGSFIDYEKKELIKTDFIGPTGWNESLKEILCP